MPEEEGGQKEQQKPAADAGGGGMLGGWKGWVIVISVVVLEAVFFLVLLTMQENRGVDFSDEGTKEQLVSLGDFNKYKLELKDLNYSIPTQSGRTSTLLMSLDIVLGYTRKEQEIGDDAKSKLTEAIWLEFQGALEAMKPDILSALVRHIHQQSINQLNSATGKEKIEVFVKEFVNDNLRSIKFSKTIEEAELDKARVTKVLITNWYIQ